MRRAFIDGLCSLAREDERVWLLVGDVGYGVVEPFRDEFPDRFVNCGIAEQNMVSVAAGMARSGLRPFVYSMANFLALRACEQVYLDVVMNNTAVTLVGLTNYRMPTHKAVHDLRIMSSMMPYSAPLDLEAAGTVIARDYPFYVRLP